MKDYGFPIIDADGHVHESMPQGIQWETALEPEYQAKAPKQIPFDTGGGRLFVDGIIWPPPNKGGRSLGREDPFKTHTARAGLWDPHKRMEDMDAEGIDTAVLFGTGIPMVNAAIEDVGLAGAICRAYNTWLADYCAPYPGRLKGMATVPIKDIEASVAEAHRAVERLGFAGIALSTTLYGLQPHSPQLDPLFSEAEAMDVPVAFHYLSRGIAFARFQDFFFTTLCNHPFEQMMTVASMICGGVLDRHPKLRIASLEGWSGWLPFWMDRMDEKAHLHGDYLRLKAKPSDYVRGQQFYISCEVDEQTLPAVLDLVGEDHILYASDYWHFDASYFGSVQELLDRKDIPQSAKRKILHDNAVRLFGLRVPRGC